MSEVFSSLCRTALSMPYQPKLPTIPSTIMDCILFIVIHSLPLSACRAINTPPTVIRPREWPIPHFTPSVKLLNDDEYDDDDDDNVEEMVVPAQICNLYVDLVWISSLFVV